MLLIILKSSLRSYIYRYMIFLFLSFDSINSLTFSVFTTFQCLPFIFFIASHSTKSWAISRFLYLLLSSALHIQNCRFFLFTLLLSHIFLPSILMSFRQFTFLLSLHFIRFLAAFFRLWEKVCNHHLLLLSAGTCSFVLTILCSVASSSNNDAKMRKRVFSG